MIDRSHALPVSGQCRVLGLSRSSAYYKPAGESPENEALMKELDALYTERPTRGSRTMKLELARKGIAVGRDRIRRLMLLMGLSAIYPRKKTSHPGKGHKIYPYLLRGLAILRPRQVYATDITYSAPRPWVPSGYG